MWKNRIKRIKTFYKWIAIGVMVLAMSCYISNNWYGLMLIQGDSMEPTFHNFQLVILNHYDRNFSRGEIIVFRSKELSSTLVKRIVAIQGDTVIIKDRKMYINDYPLESEQGVIDFEYAGILDEEIKVGNEEFVVLGDNILKSIDSRYEQVGMVAETEIIGKVIER